ncbi:DoxX family protein [bacterium]|nr:DoxX family protein [bacterium]
MNIMQNQIGLTILRVVPAAFMLFSHGLGKLQSYTEMKDSFPDPLGIGSHLSLLCTIGTEVGCAALIMLGLFSRLASLPLAFTMAIAAFVVHSADPFAKKEFALIYMVIFLAGYFMGPGRFSIDYIVRKKM